MRLAWYTGVSTALAVSVVLSAFHQRANFYSAMVYLAQSNFCLLALINFIYIIYGAFMYGLQRLCFGRLRAVEVDQLSDRAWVAITETCLAMTIFREEIGAWFLVMFTALVTGKVWTWIGDGRLEVLEQQPPANPRLFHARLVVSLLMSLAYCTWLLNYAVNTVIQQARPNMMVMFLFEFAVLTVCSLRTIARYILTLVDARIVANQTKERLAERRRQVAEERERMMRQREADEAEGREPTISEHDIPDPNDVDEIDIEVPGWEAKGQWILTLELVIDFMKLVTYMTFFTVLLMFYGLPVHIMRDVYLTASAFFKRLSALLKYRRAIQSMNNYPDATADDLGREDTCIICREEMRPWDPETNPSAVQRARPKKLPCGHILHFGCLRSWLERQQVCPTCRSPVLPPRPGAAGGQGQGQNQNGRAQGQGPQGQLGAQRQQQGQLPPNQHDQAQGNDAPGADNQPPRQNLRAFNLGPFRLEFVRHEIRNPQDLDRLLHGGVPAAPAHEADNAAQGAAPNAVPGQPDGRILTPEFNQLVNRELTSLQGLQHMQHELQTAQLLLAELIRLRQMREQAEHLHPNQPQGHHTYPGAPAGQYALPQPPPIQHARTPPPQAHGMPHYPPVFPSIPSYQYPRQQNAVLSRYTAPPSSSAIPAGSPELPEGVALPPGWSLLPLQRLENHTPGTSTPPLHHLAENNTAPPQGVAGSSAQATNGSALPPRPQGLSEQPIPSAPAVESSSQQQERVGAPQVLAPNPVMPRWAGTSQLFAQRPSSSSTPEIPDTATAVRSHPAPEGETKTLPTTAGGEHSVEGPGQAEHASEGSSSKGKGVEVEDASDHE